MHNCTLLYTWNQHNIANQLDSNKIKKKKKFPNSLNKIK